MILCGADVTTVPAEIRYGAAMESSTSRGEANPKAVLIQRREPLIGYKVAGRQTYIHRYKGSPSPSELANEYAPRMKTVNLSTYIFPTS